MHCFFTLFIFDDYLAMPFYLPPVTPSLSPPVVTTTRYYDDAAKGSCCRRRAAMLIAVDAERASVTLRVVAPYYAILSPRYTGGTRYALLTVWRYHASTKIRLFVGTPRVIVNI